MAINLKTDEYLRTEFKRALSYIIGLNGNHAPKLTWFLEKSDTTFDTSDGTNVAAGVAAAASGITIYIGGV
jgi:hypothetical protein